MSKPKTGLDANGFPKTDGEGAVVLQRLVRTLASKPKSRYFELQVTRYNAVGGDMWHVWCKTDRSQEAHGSSSLNLVEAAERVLREVA